MNRILKLNLKRLLTQRPQFIKLSIELILIILTLVALAFSVFDLVDKFNIIAVGQLKAKIALVSLMAASLVGLTIAITLTAAKVESVYVLSFVCLILTIISFLGTGNILVPKIMTSLKNDYSKIREILFGLGFIYIICFALFTTWSIMLAFKKWKN